MGRAVASDTRGPRFESSHWQLLSDIYLFTVNCIEKTKIKKKRPWMAHFLKNVEELYRAPSTHHTGDEFIFGWQDWIRCFPLLFLSRFQDHSFTIWVPKTGRKIGDDREKRDWNKSRLIGLYCFLQVVCNSHCGCGSSSWWKNQNTLVGTVVASDSWGHGLESSHHQLSISKHYLPFTVTIRRVFDMLERERDPTRW